jgi:hypothetical protein
MTKPFNKEEWIERYLIRNARLGNKLYRALIQRWCIHLAESDGPEMRDPVQILIDAELDWAEADRLGRVLLLWWAFETRIFSATDI